MGIITAIVFALAAIGLALIVYGTIRKTGFGINFSSVSCPRCKNPLPMLRKPRTPEQAKWGGWTCYKCGAEVDKWGREMTFTSQPQDGGIVS